MRYVHVLYLNQIGFTPLHWASQNGHLDVVKLLIERNAQIDVPAKVDEWVSQLSIM